MAYIDNPLSADNEMWTAQSTDPLVRALRGGAMNRNRPRKPGAGNVPPDRGGIIPPYRGRPSPGGTIPLPPRERPPIPQPRPIPRDPITGKPLPGGSLPPGMPPPTIPRDPTGKPMPGGSLDPNAPLPTIPRDPMGKPIAGGSIPPPPTLPTQKPTVGGMMTGGVSETLPFNPNEGMPYGPPNDGDMQKGLPPMPQQGLSPLNGGPISANVPFNPRGGMTAGQPRQSGLGRLMPSRRY